MADIVEVISERIAAEIQKILTDTLKDNPNTPFIKVIDGITVGVYLGVVGPGIQELQCSIVKEIVEGLVHLHKKQHRILEEKSKKAQSN